MAKTPACRAGDPGSIPGQGVFSKLFKLCIIQFFMDKEKVELAKLHVELAEQLVDEEASKAKEKSEREFIEAKFALERANSEIEDLEKVD